MIRFWIGIACVLLTGMAAALHSQATQDPTPPAFPAAPLEGAGSCGTCHAGIEDMHPWHPLTCVQCHGGNDRSSSKQGAHVSPSMAVPNDERVLSQSFDPAWVRFVNPSDLRVAPRTCGSCHAEVVDRVTKSMHATTAGHLSDGLYENGVIREKESPYGIFAVRDDDPNGEHALRSLKPIPGFRKSEDPDLLATHFQDLARKACMRCHLWSEGTAVRGRLGQDGDYRGSGCAACHVTYANDGLSRSNDPTVDRFEPGHPLRHTMTTSPPTDTCTRCHYGDASIGLHFRGMAQLVPGMPAGPDVPNTTDTPLNGAFYIKDPERTPPDIHHERGMHCVDCHTGNDLMGDGNIYGAMEDAIEIECSDCHGTFDGETSLRTSRGTRLRHLRREGERVLLRSRVTGKDHEVPQVAHIVDPKHPRYNATAAKAMNSFHDDLECYACHTSWNVNFFGFHFDRNASFTQLDMISGDRTEGRVSTQEKVFATLGEFRLGWNSEGKIAPYMVGFSSMGSVHVEDGELRMRQEMPETASGLSGMTMIHHQVHSVRPAARSCVECHRSPTTWGLGSPNFRLGRDLLLVARQDALEVLALDPKNPTSSLPVATVPVPNPIEVVIDESVIEGHVERAYVISAPALEPQTGRRGRQGGVLEISFADPLRPAVTAFLEAYDPQEVVVAGSYLLLADGEGGVKLFDRSRGLERISEVPTLRASGLAVMWPYVFVADGPGGIITLDYQNPKKPEVLSSLHLNRREEIEDDARKVAAFFQYSRPIPAERSRTEARLVLAVAAGREGLVLIDATEPTRPRILHPEPALRGARASRRSPEIAVDVVLGTRFDLGDAQGEIPTVENHYAYLLSHPRDQSRGYLNVLRITDPERPVQVGRANTGVDEVRDLRRFHIYNPPFVVDYVAVPGDSGLSILDVTKSSEPQRKGELEFTAGARSVAVEEFPLDRMVEEDGTVLKDVSHPRSRYLDLREFLKVMRVPARVLGTDEQLVGFQVRNVEVPAFGQRARAMLRELDRNGDGVVHRDELKRSRRSLLELDADQDGFLTLAELTFEGGVAPPPGAPPNAVASSDQELPDSFRLELWARLLSGLDPYPFDRDQDGRWALQTEWRELVFAALDRNGDSELTSAEIGQIPGAESPPRLGSRPRKQGVLAIDQNGDGRISAREFRLDLDRLAFLDLDRSGAIEPREYPGGAPPPRSGVPLFTTPEVLLKAFDRNRDGYLSRDEVPAGRGFDFPRYDDDRDDRLSDAELLRLVSESRRRGLSQVGLDGYARFDLDGDGRIDANEFPGPAYLFRRFDLDRDGRLEPTPTRRR